MSLNIHFVIQGPGGDDLEAAIHNLKGVKTGPDTIGRYAGRGLANTARISINGSRNTVHVINVVLGHARCTDGGSETRLAIFYAGTMVADFP